MVRLPAGQPGTGQARKRARDDRHLPLACGWKSDAHGASHPSGSVSAPTVTGRAFIVAVARRLDETRSYGGLDPVYPGRVIQRDDIFRPRGNRGVRQQSCGKCMRALR